MDEDQRPPPISTVVAVALGTSTLFAAAVTVLLVTYGAVESLGFLAFIWLGPVVGWAAAARGLVLIALLGAASPFASVVVACFALAPPQFPGDDVAVRSRDRFASQAEASRSSLKAASA